MGCAESQDKEVSPAKKPIMKSNQKLVVEETFEDAGSPRDKSKETINNSKKELPPLKVFATNP